MAIFDVTSTVDSLQATSGDGTLRGEIIASNATTTANEIDFQLPGGVQTIDLKGPLPVITDQLFINGTTATGFATSPLIEITGTGTSGNVSGPAFTVAAANSELRDLVINNFVGDGVDLNGGHDTVDGCYIGVDPTGTLAEPNTNDGISVASSLNTIGSIATNPNVISANGQNNIQISGIVAASNTLLNNYVGTNAAGTAALFAGSVPATGISISTANNTIGGVIGGSTGNFSLAVGNLISGNQDGIDFFNGANLNVVQGNFIGTDVTGKVALPNKGYGLYLTSAANNTIGGLIGAVTNVIAANGTSGSKDGIRVQAAGSIGNLIEGNYIGVGADGTTALGNAGWGVNINSASLNIVGDVNFGGGPTGLGNLIENNTTGGVVVNTGSNDGIVSNDIYQNGTGPGISLTNGGNTGVKPPTLTAVQFGAGLTRITGTFSGQKNTFYTIQFFSSATANASGFGDGQTYLPGTGGATDDLVIRTNNTGTAKFNTTIPTGNIIGQFLTATATQGGLGLFSASTYNTSTFSNAFQVTQAVVADLTVTTATSPMTGPELDQNYTYTLTVTNNGPNATTDAILTDMLPTNIKLVSVSSGTVASGVLTDDLGPLASGASDMVTIVVKPTQTGNLANTASVTGPDLDPDLTNNTSTTTATVVPAADLSVILTPSATISAVGSPLTYTLQISNFGPSTATNTVVTVQFPADFGNILVSPDQGSYTIGMDNLVTINTGILPASVTSIVTLTATPSQVESAVTAVAVNSPVADPDSTNNTTSATVTIGNAADLGVTISANPSPAQIGQDLVFTVVVTNSGPSAASEPVVTDVLPAGLTYDPNNSSAGTDGTISYDGTTVTASFNALLPNQSYTVAIAVLPTVTGLVTNTVNVGDPDQTSPVEIDPNPYNNTSSTQVAVSPSDLAVTVINPNDPLLIGQLAAFQVEVTNSGPSVATNVILTDSFIGAGSIVNVSSGNFSGTNFYQNLGTLAPGQVVDVYLIFDPSKGGPLIDQATVGGDQYDPDTSNNTSSSTNLVSPVDLSISVAASIPQLLYGGLVSYAATVTNNGPSTATNVLFAANLPADTILEAFAPTQGVVAPDLSYTNLFGNLGTLAPGASATVYYVMLPLSLGTSATTVYVGSDDYDTDLTNNVASTSTTVYNQPGTIQFASGLQYVDDTAGAVVLLVDRVGGSAGTISATYTTTDFTAVSGINYVGGTGTVTFQPDQLFAAIILPIVNSGRLDGNHGFFVDLSGATGGASIGGASSTGVVVVNTNRDLVPPAVSSLLAIPNGNQITGFAITFDKAMDPTRASLLSNYLVFKSNNGSINSGTPVALASAVYNAFNDTVILTPTTPLPSNTFYEIVANGSYGTALTDVSGNNLYGSSGPNSNYVAYYGQGTKLVYDDSRNNQVTLNLTGGGIMGIFRSVNGDASLINLYGIVPHATKLSGNVSKLNKFGTGYTVIGSINGFGQFGYVNSKLTTPQFYVGSAPVSGASIAAGVSVTAKKSTPKGPHSRKK